MHLTSSHARPASSDRVGTRCPNDYRLRKPNPAPVRTKKKKKNRLKAMSNMLDSMTYLDNVIVRSQPSRLCLWTETYPFFDSNSFINATKSSTARRGQAL